MVKLTICAVRKPGMSFEDFDRYWREEHAPLIKSVTEFSRHVRRYVQCHAVPSGTAFGSGGSWDGIAELWFDDVEAVERAFSEPRYLEIIRPDELKFVDIERCESFISEEFTVI